MAHNHRQPAKRRKAQRRPESGRATRAPALKPPSLGPPHAPASRGAWPGTPGDGPRGPHCDECCNRVTVAGDLRDPDCSVTFWPCETPGCAYFDLGSGSHLPPGCIEPLRPKPGTRRARRLARRRLRWLLTLPRH